MHLLRSSLVLFLFAASSLAAAYPQPEHDRHDVRPNLPHHDRSAAPVRHDQISSPQTPHPITPPPFQKRAAVLGFCVNNSNSRYNCQVGNPTGGHAIPLGTCWDWQCAIPGQRRCSCPSTERRLPVAGGPNALAGFRYQFPTSSSSSSQRLAPPARPRPPPRPRPLQQRPLLAAPQSAARPGVLRRTPHPDPGIAPSHAVSPDHIPRVRFPGNCGPEYQAYHNCVLPATDLLMGASCHDWRCTVPGRRRCACSMALAHSRPSSGMPPPRLK